MANIPQINLPGVNIPGGAPPPPLPQAPPLAPTSIGPPVPQQGQAGNNPPLPPNIPPPGGIPPAGVAPAVIPAPPPLVAQAPPQPAPAAAQPNAPGPAPLPEPQTGDRGEITGPPILTNILIGLPNTPFGIPPPQFQGMNHPFAPGGPHTAPGPYARVAGQPAQPVVIPGVNDPIATAPPMFGNIPVFGNMPIPMPMHPGIQGGPPLPVPAPLNAGHPPLPPLPPGNPIPNQQPIQQPNPLPNHLPPLPPLPGGFQPNVPVPMPLVPIVRPIPPPGPGQGIGSPPRPHPAPFGPAPILPSWKYVLAFLCFLALIAEVDWMSKYAGRMSTRYAGSGGGTVLRGVIVVGTLAGGVALIWFLSTFAPPPAPPVLEPRPPIPVAHAPIGPAVPLNPVFPQIGQQVPVPMPHPVNPPMPHPINPPAMGGQPGFAPPIPQINLHQINGPQLNIPQINIPQPVAPMNLPMQGLQQPVMAQPVFVATQPMKLEDPELKPGPFARPPGVPAPMVSFPRIG